MLTALSFLAREDFGSFLCKLWVTIQVEMNRKQIRIIRIRNNGNSFIEVLIIALLTRFPSTPLIIIPLFIPKPDSNYDGAYTAYLPLAKRSCNAESTICIGVPSFPTLLRLFIGFRGFRI